MPTCPSWNASSCIGCGSWTRWCARLTTNFDFKRVFSSLFNFCTGDLSALYFDIRKDALYCDAASSLKRRAALTVLDELFGCLTTWLAPILCFTVRGGLSGALPGGEGSRCI